MSQNFRYRLGGIFSLLLAGAVAWFGIYNPLQSAGAGLAVVKWMPKVTVLIGVATVFGLFFALTGDRYPYRNVERQTLTPIGWVLFGIAGALALGGYFLMETALRGMGYHY